MVSPLRSPKLPLYPTSDPVYAAPSLHRHTELLQTLSSKPSSAHLPSLYSAECNNAFFFGEEATDDGWCLAETATLTAFSAAALPLSAVSSTSIPSYLILKQCDVIHLFPTAAEARAAGAPSPTSKTPARRRSRRQAAADRTETRASTLVVAWIELQHSRNRVVVMAYPVCSEKGRQRIDNSDLHKIPLDQLNRVVLPSAELRAAADYASVVLPYCAVTYYYPDADFRLRTALSKVKGMRDNAGTVSQLKNELAAANATIQTLKSDVKELKKKNHAVAQSKSRLHNAESKARASDVALSAQIHQSLSELRQSAKDKDKVIDELRAQLTSLQSKYERALEKLDEVSNCKFRRG